MGVDSTRQLTNHTTRFEIFFFRVCLFLNEINLLIIFFVFLFFLDQLDSQSAAFVEAKDSRYGFSTKDLRKLGGSELSRIGDLMTMDHGEICDCSLLLFNPFTTF